MNKGDRSNVRAIQAYAISIVLGSAGPVLAADEQPPFSDEFPPGVACEFALGVEGHGSTQHYKEFVDKDGTVVRWMTAGKGPALTFINLDTDAELSLKSNGGVWHVTNHQDGSQTWVLTGHNVLIMFPTDLPPGPSTTLYVGQVVFTVDSNGVYTLIRSSGRATDICAALS